MASDIETIAGVQLALTIAVNTFAITQKGNAQVIAFMEQQIESMTALLLASTGAEKRLAAFNDTAEILLKSVRPDN